MRLSIPAQFKEGIPLRAEANYQEVKIETFKVKTLKVKFVGGKVVSPVELDKDIQDLINNKALNNRITKGKYNLSFCLVKVNGTISNDYILFEKNSAAGKLMKSVYGF